MGGFFFEIYYINEEKFISEWVRTINKGDDAVSKRAPPLINRLGVTNVKTTIVGIHLSRDPNVLNDCEVVTKIMAIVFDQPSSEKPEPPSPQATIIKTHLYLPTRHVAPSPSYKI